MLLTKYIIIKSKISYHPHITFKTLTKYWKLKKKKKKKNKIKKENEHMKLNSVNIQITIE
jgi:hypothetical protein